MSGIPEVERLLPLHTMRHTFERICQGRYPWQAIRGFMAEWYEGRINLHPQMVAEPLPEDYPEKYHPWASVCAATVEWFCNTYGVACPAWVSDPKYVLFAPWFSDGVPTSPQRREGIIKSTPEEFTRRNIYCGDEVSANKWVGFEELRESLAKARARRKAAQAAG